MDPPWWLGDDDDDSHKQKRTPPAFDLYSVPIPDDASRAFLLRRLAYARATRRCEEKQISTTEARLDQVKLEASMLRDEIEESRARQTQIDNYIGRLKNYIYDDGPSLPPHVHRRADSAGDMSDDNDDDMNDDDGDTNDDDGDINDDDGDINDDDGDDGGDDGDDCESDRNSIESSGSCMIRSASKLIAKGIDINAYYAMLDN